MTAILEAVLRHSIAGRQNPAFDDGGSAIGWGEAAGLVDCARKDIRNQMLGGDPLGIALDHSAACAIFMIACLEESVTVVPLPPFFSDAQRNAALDAAGAAALVTGCAWEEDRLNLTVQPRDTLRVDLPDQAALISFSSGSTGTPKGICLSADHLAAVAVGVCDFLGHDLAGRHLPLLPFGVLLEQVAGLFASMIAGGTYCPLPRSVVGMADPLRPDPRAMLEAIVDQRATSLILVPEYLSVLVSQMEATGVRLPDLRLVAVGGASIARSLLDRATELGLPVRQGYGMTEAGSVIALEDGRTRSIGSVGESIGAHRITIEDDGEIVIDGPLFLGLPGQPRTPGRFSTGDIGRIDEQGRLWIEGRKSNLIVTSLGRNISPEWIEGLLLAQPEIAQAMVRGDGEASLEALVVPASPRANVENAVNRVNRDLPDYAAVKARIVPPFTPDNGMLTDNGRLKRAVIADRFAGGGQATTFFERLVEDTREEQARFAVTPQLIAGLRGDISRADYIAYLTEAYHHVRHTVPLMQTARERLVQRDASVLVDALDDYIEEETGHEEWILDDIEAAGGDRAVAAASSPAPATKSMVDHAYRTIREGNPAGFFGMVFVLEGTSVAMASNGAAAVQQTLGLPKGAFRYLTSHGALDQHHMRFFESLMNRIDNPADQAAIVDMARDMFGLFGGVFGSIELEASRRAA